VYFFIPLGQLFTVVNMPKNNCKLLQFKQLPPKEEQKHS